MICNIQDKKTAFTFLDENLDIVGELSYSELNNRCLSLSKKLPHAISPILLLFENVEEFIIAFLACEKANLTSVPMFFPKSKRHFERLEGIIQNAGIKIVLCEQANKDRISKGISNIGNYDIQLLTLEEIEKREEKLVEREVNNLMFIQYTSGSTSAPKGVLITRNNIRSNQEMIRNLFGCDENSIILSWLPFYHDMGLIGNILHALYVGATCIILPSLSVIQSPFLWLEAISKFKVTHSGGPNFSFDLCNSKIDTSRLDSLDLSTWKVAYNGSEPIKKNTIESFIEKFKLCGFRSDSYYTCYGLAEATLLVSGSAYNSKEAVISSGKIQKPIEVCILDLSTKKVLSEGVGEIAIHGESVTSGYYMKTNSDLFEKIDGKLFLKTGDVGFLKDDILTVTGRSKEMIIINGKNYFPYDIENQLSESLDFLENNGVIVSYLTVENMDLPIVFGELKKTNFREFNYQEAINSIDKLMIEILGVETVDVLFFTPRKLSRTSSGKLQRVKVLQDYKVQELDFLVEKSKLVPENDSSEYDLVELIMKEDRIEMVRDYLFKIINRKLKIDIDEKDIHSNLIDLGLDSLASVEIVNTINSELEINLNVVKIMNIKSLYELEEFVKNLLWLKLSNTKGEEIVI